MAYDRQKIFEQAKEAIKKNNLFFIEDIIAFLPIQKSTFYEYFKLDSDDTITMKHFLNWLK